MLKKTLFKKLKNGLYENTEPITDFSYEGCLDTRNDLDKKFYSDRMSIVHDSFLKILPPLLQLLPEERKEIKVLDVGCGDGVILLALHTIRTKTKKNISLYGLDIDPHILRKIKVKMTKIQASCTDMPLDDNMFDLVTCSQTIEHLTVADIKMTLKEIYRVLRPGGICYFETPNPESLIAKSMGDEWWMYIDLHLILLPPRPLHSLLQKVGFININSTSRAELDIQMDEAREITRRLLTQKRYKLLKPFIYGFIKLLVSHYHNGGITVATAQKPSQT